MGIFGFEIRRVKKNLTCLHPQVKTLTEFAFEIDGREFHQFKNLLDMPPARYQRAEEFIREAEMRITGKDLLKATEAIKKAVNKGDLTRVVLIVSAMENLCKQFIETDTFYRLFTCLFFDLDEDITDYDFDYNEEKLKLFKSQPRNAFFFTQPMKNWLPQIDLSEQDLEVFLVQTEAHKKHLLSFLDSDGTTDT
jgi:hypothetical protein